MDRNINPFAAALVILVLLTIIGVYAWSSGLLATIRGPAHLHTDPYGNLYVGSYRSILKFSPSGELLDEFELEKIGIRQVTGDFAVFSSGDLLLSPLNYDPSFLEGVAVFLRREDMVINKQASQSGLIRCRFDSYDCSPYTHSDVAYNYTFHMELDQQSNELYVADTTRHLVRRYNANGDLVGKNDISWHYPNGMQLDGDRLYVIDTNNLRLRALDTSMDDLGDISLPDFKGGRSGRDQMPANIALIDQQLWIARLDNSMDQGGIYRYDSDLKFLGRVDLPRTASPMDIVEHQGYALVSDPVNFKIYRFNMEGEAVTEYRPDALEEHYAMLIGQRDSLKGYVNKILVGLGVLMALALLIAYRTGKSKDVPAHIRSSNEPSTVVADDPSITWLKRDMRDLTKQVKLAGGLLAAATAMPAWLVYTTGGATGWTDVLVWILMSSLILLITFGLPMLVKKSGLGYRGKGLVVRDTRGKLAFGEGKQVLYSRDYISINGVTITLRDGHGHELYDEKDLIANVYPRLVKGTALDRDQASTLYQKQFQPYHIVLVFLLFAGMAYFMLR